MTVSERVPLASLTTFKVGGEAWFVIACESAEDIQTALAFSRERGLPWYVLGGGSNLVASDVGYEGVILLMKIPGMSFDEGSNEKTTVIVGAGVVWDSFVHECTERALWGIENLAGIPGSVGAAPVQNIGAYGAELADAVSWVEVFDTESVATRRFTKEECGFGYRESRFKHDSSLIIMHVAFELQENGAPHTSYADLTKQIQNGAVLDTPMAIAAAVRDIRARKFPDLHTTGTAGSFFKNPTISKESYAELQARYPELPGYPSGEGSNEMIKVSLAWILDHVLNLRGYTQGLVRLFESQPLVIASEQGATAHDIDALAHDVEDKVLIATGIQIEREVRFL